ncbi:MAG TPA: PilN domain-containing protein [Oscillatoriaceae cyanobacterium]
MATININLLPEELRSGTSGGGGGADLPPMEALVPIVLAVVVAVLIAAVPTLANMLWLDPQDQALQATGQQLDADIGKYKAVLKKVKVLSDNQQELRQQLATLQSVAQGRAPYADMLNELRSLTPEDLWFDSLKTDSTKGTVEVDGDALDYNSVAYFYHNLAHSDFFQDPELGQTEMSSTNGVELVKFQLTVTMHKPQ